MAREFRRGKGRGMAADLARMRMVIGGRAVDAISGRTFESENPFTGRGWAVVPDGGREDVAAAVAAARSALDGEWGQLAGFGRAALLRRLGDLIPGLPDREISERLFISERTVHHHVSAVLAKIGVSSRTAAVREAARMGIGSPI